MDRTGPFNCSDRKIHTEGMNGVEARAADSGDKDDPRRVALDGVMLQIERCYGRGSIQTLGHSGNELCVATDSTGYEGMISHLCLYVVLNL